MRRLLHEVSVSASIKSAFSHLNVVSLQTVATSVNALVSGLTQVKGEIAKLKGIRLSPEDQFVKVMEVYLINFPLNAC
jgi:hypothetical protein